MIISVIFLHHHCYYHYDYLMVSLVYHRHYQSADQLVLIDHQSFHYHWSSWSPLMSSMYRYVLLLLLLLLQIDLIISDEPMQIEAAS